MRPQCYDLLGTFSHQDESIYSHAAHSSPQESPTFQAFDRISKPVAAKSKQLNLMILIVAATAVQSTGSWVDYCLEEVLSISYI